MSHATSKICRSLCTFFGRLRRPRRLWRFPVRDDRRRGQPPSRLRPPSGRSARLREQAAMQQEWLKKRLDTFLSGADAQARHRPVGRADARVQRGPGLHGHRRARDLRGAAAHDLRVLRQVRGDRRTPGRGVRRAASRSAAPRKAASSRRARSTKRGPAGDVGRGQQAELWGDEQWQVLKPSSKSASRR